MHITTPADCEECGQTFEADWLQAEEVHQGIPDAPPLICGPCQHVPDPTD